MATRKTKFVLCIGILIGLISQILDAFQSGIYIDNGIDQTIMQSALESEEKLNVSNEILEFLGLSGRPEYNRTRHSTYMRKSAPKFLIDVYYRITQAEELGDYSSRFKRSLEDQRKQPGGTDFITPANEEAIEESDVIMTFSSLKHVKHNIVVSSKREIPTANEKNEKYLWFNTSAVSNDSQLIMAALRLYKKATAKRSTLITITIYNAATTATEMTAINTTSDFAGWLEFNVTQIVRQWLVHPATRQGFLLRGNMDMDAIGNAKFSLQELGLFDEPLDGDYQPFMIGFFKRHELLKGLERIRKRRSITHQRQKKKKTEMINPLFENSADYNMRSCQMKTLYIDFKDLGWHDWIIAPDGYGAFYCSGECNFPLNAHMNATNHAIVQTLVHLLEPQKVPKPCCAPTRLGALPVLYHLNDENVNLKKYRSMIVKSCGCH